MPRTPRVIGIFTAFAVIALLAGFFAMQFLYQENTESLAQNTSAQVREDGEEFTGFAVFPTWNTLEPATFPLLVDGQAQASWFVDDTFPVEVRTHEGQVLGRGNAYAQTPTDADGIRSFYASVEAMPNLPPYSGPALLVLLKASLSGDTSTQFKTPVFVETLNQ